MTEHQIAGKKSDSKFTISVLTSFQLYHCRVSQCEKDQKTDGNYLIIQFSVDFSKTCRTVKCHQDIIDKLLLRIRTKTQINIPIPLLNGTNINFQLDFCSLVPSDSSTTNSGSYIHGYIVFSPCSIDRNQNLLKLFCDCLFFQQYLEFRNHSYIL